MARGGIGSAQPEMESRVVWAAAGPRVPASTWLVGWAWNRVEGAHLGARCFSPEMAVRKRE